MKMIDGKKYLELTRKIYGDELCFADEKFINPKCDKLWNKINHIVSNSDIEEMKDLHSMFMELSLLLEREQFARGMRFMFDSISEINSIELNKSKV